MINNCSVFSKFNLSCSGEVSASTYTISPSVLSRDLLDSISLSNTSSGVLCKWLVYQDNSYLYYKSGTLNSLGLFSARQPQSELMAYIIGAQLGFNNLVETRCALMHFPETDKYAEQDALVSYTKSFLGSDESYIGIHKYFSKEVLEYNISNLYELFTCKFPFIKRDLDCMLLFDFIICNTDRHLNNFGLIEGNGVAPRLSPLFDNGRSLLADFSDDELSRTSDLFFDKKVKTKPFRSNPYNQIKLIDFNSLPNNLKDNLLNKTIDWDLVFCAFDKKDFALSELRKSKIKTLVESRLYYVKGLLSQMV